ncbi:MAG TPA: Ig-like domain-containing protein, partial [Candidatus Saccharibacteria bacterium]|nr:Ig-like domain-containing protein [Candidatus Saccharibacteria bacterium]
NNANGAASWDASDADTVHYIYKYWNDIVGNTYKELSPWTTTSSSTVLPGVFNQGDGTHYFSVAAVDAAGNQSAFSAAFAVVFDATAPVVTINALTTTDETPTLTGDVDDDAAVVVVSINGTDYPAVNNGDGTWTLVLTTPLAVGSYTAVVTATDTAGNADAATANITVQEVVIEENDPETDEDDIVGPQTIVTPDEDVLGDQDDQTGEEDDATAEEDESGVAAATDDKTGDSDNTILGLAWYWWLLILAALAAAGWWLVGAYRRRNAEE